MPCTNLETKVLEIRDSGTFIPMLAININPAIDDDNSQRYLMRRCGYSCDGTPNVILTRLDGDGMATNDPYAWRGSHTYANAHHFILDHWDELKDGDVIDVEFILGETKEKKVSERFNKFA